jgi:hypothetical protein
MVPYTFTAEEIALTKTHIIKAVHTKSRFVNGQVLGDPFVFYKDIAALLGYEIESEGDGDRLGIVSGQASELEFPNSKLLISAVVVSVDFRRPGAGFYELADRLGLFHKTSKRANPDGIDELRFWKQHVSDIVKKYGRQ